MPCSAKRDIERQLEWVGDVRIFFFDDPEVIA